MKHWNITKMSDLDTLKVRPLEWGLFICIAIEIFSFRYSHPGDGLRDKDGLKVRVSNGEQDVFP
jgi:hypothetical protein